MSNRSNSSAEVCGTNAGVAVVEEVLNLYLDRNENTGKGRYATLQRQINAILPDLKGSPAAKLMTDRLLRLLDETNDERRSHWVVDALGQVGRGNPAVADRLLRLLDESNDDNLRPSVVSALLGLQAGQQLNLPLLFVALASDYWQVRQRAVQALSKQAQDQELAARSKLLPLLADADEDVQQATIEALVKLTPADERNDLLNQDITPMLKARESNVRQAALTAIVASLPHEEAVQRLYALTQQPASGPYSSGELYDEAYSTLATLLAAEERTYAEAERCSDIERR